jgi:UDPglucose--hexose-1-phosphate uridylyltransferase
MSNLRHDPVNDQWVAIAKNRQERPMEFIPLEQTRQQMICPFCKGNEDETPKTIVAYRGDGTTLTDADDPTSWTVRVVPNKYPSFANENGWQPSVVLPSSVPNPGVPPQDIDRPWEFRTTESIGVQELIIPSPRHITTISELRRDELLLSFRAYRDRLRKLSQLDYIKHAMLFMNCRLAAGASLGHIHTQLIGSPVVSGHLGRRVERNSKHFAQHGCSLIDSVARWEMNEEVRVVNHTENFVVVCPFASRFAFQVWIIPLRQRTDFLSCPAEMRDELAEHCQALIQTMESALDSPAYNLLLHLDPFAAAQPGQWYLEIFPRLTRAAGFEWGTDIWVNPVPPSVAARQLRVQD